MYDSPDSCLWGVVQLFLCGNTAIQQALSEGVFSEKKFYVRLAWLICSCYDYYENEAGKAAGDPEDREPEKQI